MTTSLKHTMLVIHPGAQRPKTAPWVGLFCEGTWLWKKNMRGYRPGNVDYWSLFKQIKKRLPPDAIYVVTGPGPYTATRAAVSIANALGFAWDVPVYASTADTTAKGLEQRLSRAAKKSNKGFSMQARALPHYTKKPY